MEKPEFDLDAAAIPDEDSSGSESSSEDSQSEQKVENEEGSEGEGSSASQKADVEESRVPYSRFETVNERAIRAEEQLKALQAKLDSAQASGQTVQQNGELPDYWVELYGDSDLSRKAWSAEQKRISAIEERATTRAVEGMQQAQAKAAQAQEETVNEMVGAFDTYAAKHKRSFTDAEQSSILDIMDELSPKDDAGFYEVDPVRYLDRAVEIHELRSNKANASKKASRQRAAQLAGADSDSESTGDDKTGHFRAGDWGSWRNNPALPK